MKTLSYQSGEKIMASDQVTYHGEPGVIKFVVTEKIGEPAMDWYLDQFREGGLMVNARNFGDVFIESDDIDEYLTLVSRSEKGATT